MFCELSLVETVIWINIALQMVSKIFMYLKAILK